MTPMTCEQLVASYIDWLKLKITTKDVNGVCEITTPFLDRHNDRLQIYVEPNEGAFRLTDDGYIIGDLESSGCPLDGQSRKRALATILSGFGVQHKDGELFIEATAENFPRRKHSLLQAMMAVNDMFMTTKHRDSNIFFDDVQAFLDQSQVRYSPSVEFTGKSGYQHYFDFLIPKSPSKPERLIRAISSASRDAATSLLFAWTDTKEVRPPKSEIYAIVNDASKSFNRDAVEAFRHYEVKTIPWSKRNLYIAELAA